MDEPHAQPAAISRSRLEMLFDGVFAIAMTILVLELKVPELVARRSVPELATALAHQGTTFFSYLLSFAILGMFWFRHNTQYRHFHTITGGVLVAHFVQLAAAASFPFFAALFGHYPTNPLSWVIYLGCILVYAWASFIGWLFAKKTGAFSPGMADATYRRVRKRGLLSCVILSALFTLYVVNLIVLRGGK
jgi:uncharacterized membrane protein